MQSGPDFFTWRVLDDWLARYVTLRVRTPEAIDAMRAREAEFELVPVPRALMDRLSAETGGGEFLPFGSLGLKGGGGASLGFVDAGVWDPRVFAERFVRSPAGVDEVRAAEKARHAEALVSLIKQLRETVESGDLDRVLALVSDDYQDAQGHTKAQVGESLERLFKVSSGRRLIMTKAEQYEIIGRHPVVVVSGAWQADVTGTEGTRMVADTFRLELIFSQDREGNWTISGARHA